MNKPLVINTGASSGIGAAMAKVFSDAGYPVGLIARNLKAMQELNLPNAICQSVDVTDHDALKKAIYAAENKFGSVDCLINNAGFSKNCDFVDMESSEHAKMININLLEVINGIEAVLPTM